MKNFFDAWYLFGSWWQAVVLVLPLVVVFVLCVYPPVEPMERTEPNDSIHLVFHWLCMFVTFAWYYGVVMDLPVTKYISR